MMNRGIVALAAPALLAGVMLGGCEGGSSARQAARDAHDVAMVERMSREPFKPIIPDPIGAVDIGRYGLDRPGCTFRKTGDADPLFIADRDEGYMRIGDDLKRYAAKQASAELPGKARSTYVGLSSWVDLMRRPDAGTNADADRWPARLIIHDALERVAFMADGSVTCTE